DSRRPVISAFIVEKGQKGLSITNPYDKMGVRGSDTAEIILNEVRVPAHHILGDPNKGFKQFLYTLDGGRISIAALSVGIA
ncbi:acyl-CoA dehydrogenase, partial [Peribacillus sp. SIMBA_075]